jgi:hypothetical protein
MWWRRFASKNKPLPKGATFFQRIQNKEFEFSHFYWQAKFCEIEINQQLRELFQDVTKSEH